MSEFKASSSGSSPSKQNTEVANKEDFFANAENFIAGNIETKIVIIIEQKEIIKIEFRSISDGILFKK
jgi:hypothetical protein